MDVKVQALKGMIDSASKFKNKESVKSAYDFGNATRMYELLKSHDCYLTLPHVIGGALYKRGNSKSPSYVLKPIGFRGCPKTYGIIQGATRTAEMAEFLRKMVEVGNATIMLIKDYNPCKIKNFMNINFFAVELFKNVPEKKIRALKHIIKNRWQNNMYMGFNDFIFALTKDFAKHIELLSLNAAFELATEDIGAVDRTPMFPVDYYVGIKHLSHTHISQYVRNFSNDMLNNLQGTEQNVEKMWKHYNNLLLWKKYQTIEIKL